MYRRVVGLNVFIWGRRVGSIVPDAGSGHAFQYDPQFVRSGLELAPFMMPLSDEVYHTSDFRLNDRLFWNLPGLLADALPDDFGNGLIDRWMASEGIARSDITPLDRLAYVGSRGMGALTFEPSREPGRGRPSALDMRQLVAESRAATNVALADSAGSDALREILRLGTSAGGAQAKAVVGWNPVTDGFVFGDGNVPDGFQHWIVKFASPNDPEIGEREYAIHRKALAAGIVMSECRLYELDGLKHFMTRRFDRDGARRYHLQTLCALRHLTHSSPAACKTYDALFDTATDLGLGYEALEQLFRRMAFNVLIREIDDHAKNFSFLMHEDGKWELAPAYDLTGFHFSGADSARAEWENSHALSVNGKFSKINVADLLAVGEKYGLGTAKRIIGEVQAAVEEKTAYE